MSNWFSENLLGKRMDVTGDYWVDDPIYGLSKLDGRPLDSLSGDAPILTGQQLYILRTIALVGASISLVSGIIVGWWFVRMKRSFRHQYAPGTSPIYLYQVYDEYTRITKC